MDNEERVKVLEGEFKLIKSELQQTLGSVRDFLLDLKLPPVREESVDHVTSQLPETVPTPETPVDVGSEPGYGPGPGGGQGQSGLGASGGSEDGSNSLESVRPTSETPSEAPSNTGEIMDEMGFPEDLDDETGISSGDVPTEKQPENNQESLGESESTPAEQPLEMKPASPRVNVLANLIRWVAEAKNEIGQEQMPVFLDVYATTGHLTPEVKDTILHLVEISKEMDNTDQLVKKHLIISEQTNICLEMNRLAGAGTIQPELNAKIQRLTELVLQQAANSNKADIWSKLILELHSILTEGGNGFRQMESFVPATASEKCEGIPGSGDAECQADPEDMEDAMQSEEYFPDEVLEPDDTPMTTLRSSKAARLRLVMPVGDGKEQELDLGSLFIATEGKPKDGNTSNKSTKR
jgi:hypothetical protein